MEERVEEEDKEEEDKEEEEEDDEEEEEEEVVNKTWKADNFEMVLPLEPSELEAIKSAKIQKFVVPKINFEAQTYPDLIDWD